MLAVVSLFFLCSYGTVQCATFASCGVMWHWVCDTSDPKHTLCTHYRTGRQVRAEHARYDLEQKNTLLLGFLRRKLSPDFLVQKELGDPPPKHLLITHSH